MRVKTVKEANCTLLMFRTRPRLRVFVNYFLVRVIVRLVTYVKTGRNHCFGLLCELIGKSFVMFLHTRCDVPSGDDIFTVAGNGDNYSPTSLGGGLVSDFGVNLTMLELVAVHINVNDEVVNALQIDMSVGNGEAFRRFDLPFA